MKIGMFTWLATVLEKIGWRCSKCNAWWTSKITRRYKVHGSFIVTDLMITSCCCSQCNHLMSEKCDLPKEKAEV